MVLPPKAARSESLLLRILTAFSTRPIRSLHARGPHLPVPRQYWKRDLPWEDNQLGEPQARDDRGHVLSTLLREHIKNASNAGLHRTRPGGSEGRDFGQVGFRRVIVSQCLRLTRESFWPMLWQRERIEIRTMPTACMTGSRRGAFAAGSMNTRCCRGTTCTRKLTAVSDCETKCCCVVPSPRSKAGGSITRLISSSRRNGMDLVT